MRRLSWCDKHGIEQPYKLYTFYSIIFYFRRMNLIQPTGPRLFETTTKKIGSLALILCLAIKIRQ